MDKEQLTVAYERTCLCHNSEFSITTVIDVVVKLQYIKDSIIHTITSLSDQRNFSYIIKIVLNWFSYVMLISAYLHKVHF